MPDIFVGSSKPKAEKKKANLENVHLAQSMKKNFGFLTAFAVRPPRIRYEAQENDEKIVLFLRRHFFTNVGWIIVTFC